MASPMKFAPTIFPGMSSSSAPAANTLSPQDLRATAANPQQRPTSNSNAPSISTPSPAASSSLPSTTWPSYPPPPPNPTSTPTPKSSPPPPKNSPPSSTATPGCVLLLAELANSRVEWHCEDEDCFEPPSVYSRNKVCWLNMTILTAL